MKHTDILIIIGIETEVNQIRLKIFLLAKTSFFLLKESRYDHNIGKYS